MKTLIHTARVFFRWFFAPTSTPLVMFDLDGTLVNTLPDISQALDQAFVASGFYAPGLVKARLWVGNGSLKLIQRALVTACELPENQLEQVLVENVQKRFFDYYAQCCDVDSHLYEGVLASLEWLKANYQ